MQLIERLHVPPALYDQSDVDDSGISVRAAVRLLLCTWLGGPDPGCVAAGPARVAAAAVPGLSPALPPAPRQGLRMHHINVSVRLWVTPTQTCQHIFMPGKPSPSRARATSACCGPRHCSRAARHLRKAASASAACPLASSTSPSTCQPLAASRLPAGSLASLHKHSH